MELEVKEGVVVNTQEVAVNLLVKAARQIAAAQLGNNLDAVTNRIDKALAKIADEILELKRAAGELELAIGAASGYAKEVLIVEYNKINDRIIYLNNISSNVSRGDLLVALKDKTAIANLKALNRIIRAACRSIEEDLRNSDAGDLAQTTRRPTINDALAQSVVNNLLN